MSNKSTASMKKRSNDFDRSRSKGKGSKRTPKSLDAKIRSAFKKFDKYCDKFTNCDEKVTGFMAICASKESSYGWLRPVLKMVEITCHGIPWILSVVTAILMTHDQDAQVKLLNLFAALLLDLMVVGIFKFIFMRQRPKHNKMDMFATLSIDNYSFPSGHATRAAMVTWFFIEQWNLDIYSRVFFYIWTLVVGWSRIALGRHHIFDVVCGLVIGVLEYCIVARYWLSPDFCHSILTPIYEHLHL